MVKWRWLLVVAAVGMLVGPQVAAEQDLYVFGPEAIAGSWQPFMDPETEEFLAPGSVTLVGGSVVIGTTFGEPWGGGVLGPWLVVDLSRNPMIVLENAQPEDKWALKGHVRSLKPDWKIEGWGIYLHGDSDLTGDVEIDLNDALREFGPLSVVRQLPDGPIALRLWMWGVNGSVALDGIRIVYAGE